MNRAPNDTVQFVDKVSGAIHTPVSVAADILKDLIERVRKATEMKISRLVVTIPADFKQEQRLATKEAIRNAGFSDNEFRILNEPTAAALAYFVDNPVKEENIIVYDLGGGTFDCTVIHIVNNRFHILAHDGDEGIGGVLFDKILFDYVMNYCKQQYGKSPLPDEKHKLYRSKLRKLLNYCEEAKITLSVGYDTEISLSDFANQLGVDDDDELAIHMSLGQLTSLFETDVKKTIAIMDRALASAKLQTSDISRVLYVGGSCHIKCVKEQIKQHFGGRDVDCHEVHPDEVVAKGACIFSELWRESKDGNTLMLNNNQPIYIDELTSITLNVQVSRDLCWPFLEKGKPINGQQITVTFQDRGKTGTTVYNILEGDSDKKCNNVYNYVKDCSLLKSYSIKYAPEDRGPNGAIEYLFIFSIETDGVISLEIRNKRNNKVYKPRETIRF